MARNEDIDKEIRQNESLSLDSSANESIQSNEKSFNSMIGSAGGVGGAGGASFFNTGFSSGAGSDYLSSLKKKKKKA